MRTRRSPRNQMILWRALGGPLPETLRSDTPAAIERMLATSGLNKRTRSMLARDLVRAHGRTS